MKAFLVSLFSQPAVLALVASGVLYLLTLGAKAFHDFVVSWTARHQSKAQQVLSIFLGMVDSALVASVSGISADVQAAKADGVITPDELKDIARKEVTRLKAFLGDSAVVTLEKGLGIGGEALTAYLQQMVADRLKWNVVSPKAAPAT